jgi:hypothetical protein
MNKYLVTRTRTDPLLDPWRPDVDVLDEVTYVDSRVNNFPAGLRNHAQRWFELQFALKLLLQSRKYHGFAVGRCGIWLPILLRLFRQKKPIVLTDTEWRGGSGTINRLACLSSTAVTAFSREEIRRYCLHFRIPETKFVWQPATYTALIQSKDEGYIFSGGNQARDWPTFLEAVSPLAWPVRLVTSSSFSFGPLPSHISVSGPVKPQEFHRIIANASCVVVPTLAEPLRITGMTTWVAAMALGKVVICTEPLAAPDYFVHGVSGFCVDHNDVTGLRKTINMVMQDEQLRSKVGRAAREHALREFSPESFRQRILRLLDTAEKPSSDVAVKN